MSEHFIEAIIAFIKDWPILLLLYFHYFVAALPTIMLVLGFIYLLMQIIYLRWKWKRERERHDKYIDNIDMGHK